MGFFSGMCCGSQQDIPIRELRRDSGISYNFIEYLENLVRRVAMSWSFLTCRMMQEVVTVSKRGFSSCKAVGHEGIWTMRST